MDKKIGNFGRWNLSDCDRHHEQRKELQDWCGFHQWHQVLLQKNIVWDFQERGEKGGHLELIAWHTQSRMGHRKRFVSCFGSICITYLSQKYRKQSISLLWDSFIWSLKPLTQVVNSKTSNTCIKKNSHLLFQWYILWISMSQVP